MEPNLPEDSDQWLLRCFAERGDEAAFRRLVERHAGLVRGVAVRCMGDAAAAEEVAQSVFYLLAQRAGTVPAGHLPGWLHRTALLTACNVRRKTLRYQQALRDMSDHQDVMKGTTQHDAGSSQAAWEQIAPHLDEAIARLSGRARQPLIMRFFESLSIRDIAARTGSSEDAVRKAIERALTRLGTLLRCRGIATHGTALGVMLTAQSLLAPPASAAALASGALTASQMAGSAVAPSSFLSSLTGNAGGAAFLKGVAAALLLAAIPVVMLWREASRQPQPANPREAPRQTGQPVAAVAPSASPPATAAAASPALADATQKPAAPAGKTEAEMREKGTREAERELARMNLYLPGLSEDQRQRILALHIERSLARAAAFEQARQSGAFGRLSSGIAALTAEDRALFRAAHGWQGAATDDADLQSILTPDQYALHQESMARRRVNDAEGVASDALRALGQSMDLSQEQKDSIFQKVAGFELEPRADGSDTAADLPSPFREEARDRIILQHLSPEQAALFQQRREDDRRRREQFLQSLQPAR